MLTPKSCSQATVGHLQEWSGVVCKVCGCLDGSCLVSREVPRQENVSTQRTVSALCGIAQGAVLADQGLLEMGKAVLKKVALELFKCCMP